MASVYSCTLSTVGPRFSSKKNHIFSSSGDGKAAGKRSFAVRAEGGGGINPAIRKDEAKVVDNIKITELSKPLTAYCRCWRSGTFPLCDGSHVKHNKETGDNVGPLLLKK